MQFDSWPTVCSRPINKPCNFCADVTDVGNKRDNNGDVEIFFIFVIDVILKFVELIFVFVPLVVKFPKKFVGAKNWFTALLGGFALSWFMIPSTMIELLFTSSSVLFIYTLLLHRSNPANVICSSEVWLNPDANVVNSKSGLYNVCPIVVLVVVGL